MHRCPFFDDYPDIFVIAVVVLAFAYCIYYGIYCLFLYLLSIRRQQPTGKRTSFKKKLKNFPYDLGFFCEKHEQKF